tara:strand:+ start:303 stop:587 length:285 start_codon:yes stop_codon:yes gene_type:complete
MKLSEIPEGIAMFVEIASHPELFELPKEDRLTLLQQKVDGYVEAVNFSSQGRNYVALANEEGLIYGLPYNELASHYTNVALYGNVVIINSNDWK